MFKPLALLCSILALGLVGTGCGGEDDSSGGNARGGGGGAAEQREEQTRQAPEKAGEDAGSGGSGAGGETKRVGMKEIQFTPRDITVKKGTTVTWTNNEAVNHDVTKKSGPGPKFSSGTGNMGEGESYDVTFKQAGKYDYVCQVHPGMDGTVTVK